jgi:hypothetical protein
MEVFFLQTCAHASVEKNGIEGLGKMISRTHLHAPHDAVHVIHRAGDTNWHVP